MRQTKIVNKTLKITGMDSPKPVQTLVHRSMLQSGVQQIPLEPAGCTLYQIIVVSLMYLVSHSHRKKAVVDGVLGWHVQSPKEAHMLAAKRALRHLWETYNLLMSSKTGK